MDKRRIQQPAKVLIVDDTEVNRMILHSLLTTYGIVADMAESGQECLELCHKKRYDLIILDHRMPDMDGMDTIKILRERFAEQEGQIPVVCHTSEDVESNREYYLAAGFSEVLEKPVIMEKLIALLDNFLPSGSFEEPDSHKDEERLEMELEKMPDFLREVSALDLRAAVRHCQTAEDYMDVLSVFANSIEEKADEIERYFVQENWEAYTLKVHSLKSMFRLIGAGELADQTAALEAAGRNRQIDLIRKETQGVLKGYRALLPYLDSLTGGDSGVDEDALPEIDPMLLEDAYMAISDFTSCYDADSIQMVLDSLKQFKLQDSDRQRLADIRKELMHMDWEAIRKTLEK